VRAASLLIHLAIAGATAACAGSADAPATGGPTVAPPPKAPAAAPPPTRITILYTTDEHGWLLPVTENGETKGGAANMLTRWMLDEGHCIGGPCTESHTVALSGGDNWTGPAVSSYFHGEPTALVMKRMGYAASAFGNHDYDFGRDQFLRNRDLSSVPYVAANMKIGAGEPQALQLPPFLLVERAGVKVGVVGLATESTPRTALASRFEGIVFEPPEATLGRTIPAAWAAGADAVVLVAHECPDVMMPILERHPEWQLSFVGLGHCHKPFRAEVHGAPVMVPGWRMRQYGRVRLDVHPRRAGQPVESAGPVGARATLVDVGVVDVVQPADAQPRAAPDRELTATVDYWKSALEMALGGDIGFTASGLEHKSSELGAWVAESWRDELGVDLAIVNDGGLRQGLSPGAIPLASIYSVMPFDNRLLVVTVTGSDLLDSLANKETIVAGLRDRKGQRIVTRYRAPIDPAKKYTVATIDFLYFGGDGYRFQKQDPSPRETGLDWRAPVIEWTRRMKTTPATPLEVVVRRSVAR
jgi:2',3'-cyclic-nucleotide 2'-phosphodiesterase (5'-nucleotidase family)